jgi:hypothetical protein
MPRFIGTPAFNLCALILGRPQFRLKSHSAISIAPALPGAAATAGPLDASSIHQRDNDNDNEDPGSVASASGKGIKNSMIDEYPSVAASSSIIPPVRFLRPPITTASRIGGPHLAARLTSDEPSGVHGHTTAATATTVAVDGNDIGTPPSEGRRLIVGGPGSPSPVNHYTERRPLLPPIGGRNADATTDAMTMTSLTRNVASPVVTPVIARVTTTAAISNSPLPALRGIARTMPELLDHVRGYVLYINRSSVHHHRRFFSWYL